MFEKIFHLSENNTNIKREVIAGLTTFMTMAYIVAVNPAVLSKSGMPIGAVFTATVLASVVGTVIMALVANYPFGMAPGMGLNAYFTYTICIGMKIHWQVALAMSFIEGIIFLILNFFKVRQAIIDAIPKSLKTAISIGIGFFIAFIGLQNAKIIVKNDGTLVGLGNLKDISVLIAVFGIIFIAILSYKGVKGAYLIGMLVLYIVSLICGVAKLPSKNIVSLPPSVAPVFLNFNFAAMDVVKAIPVIITMLFLDVFDSVGTLVGLATKAGFLDKKGNVKNADKVLTADAVGSTMGACLGTSTPVVFVESASGIAEGGRTGLTGIVIAAFFALSLFFAPIFTSIPDCATAPVLILVGFLMMEPITTIDFSDITEGVPVFLTLILTLLTYSITEGLSFGFVSYVLLKLFTGKHKEISVPLYIISALFVVLFAIQ